MSTHNVCFCGEIRKNNIFWLKEVPDLELCNEYHNKHFYGEIEDIYSFAVNTINIVIECNENISIFTSVKHE